MRRSDNVVTREIEVAKINKLIYIFKKKGQRDFKKKRHPAIQRVQYFCSYYLCGICEQGKYLNQLYSCVSWANNAKQLLVNPCPNVNSP